MSEIKRHVIEDYSGIPFDVTGIIMKFIFPKNSNFHEFARELFWQGLKIYYGGGTGGVLQSLYMI